jgi:hypothetical protein
MEEILAIIDLERRVPAAQSNPTSLLNPSYGTWPFLPGHVIVPSLYPARPSRKLVWSLVIVYRGLMKIENQTQPVMT